MKRIDYVSPQAELFLQSNADIICTSKLAVKDNDEEVGIPSIPWRS